MAAYISVPRDLTRVKSKILFNLTKRQLICLQNCLRHCELFFKCAYDYNIHLIFCRLTHFIICKN